MIRGEEFSFTTHLCLLRSFIPGARVFLRFDLVKKLISVSLIFNYQLSTVNSQLQNGCAVLPCLHRKEVIQPHLPIRLPCYDLTPIIEPTFDCCPPALTLYPFVHSADSSFLLFGHLLYGYTVSAGLAHRLRVFPTLMV